jgi:hypothetical protein
VLVVVGVAIGLGGICFSTSLPERLFRGVGMPAWSVFIGIAALTTVSLIAMYLPARLVNASNDGLTARVT